MTQLSPAFSRIVMAQQKISIQRSHTVPTKHVFATPTHHLSATGISFNWHMTHGTPFDQLGVFKLILLARDTWMRRRTTRDTELCLTRVTRDGALTGTNVTNCLTVCGGTPSSGVINVDFSVEPKLLMLFKNFFVHQLRD